MPHDPPPTTDATGATVCADSFLTLHYRLCD